MTGKVLTHKFVEFIPIDLEDGVIYVSVAYATAIHRCCCGCGNRVVTPLSPADWKLIFDGRSISLHPSIGNWSFPCRSHYWIRNNEVIWADRMSERDIIAGRKKDARAAAAYFGANNARKTKPQPKISEKKQTKKAKGAFKKRIKKLFGGT